MARYIDANELFDEIKSLYVYLGGDNVFNKTAKESVLDCIDKAPTANVVEVVHCNDCVRHGTCIFEDTFNTTGLADEYRFCGVGKRKVGDTLDKQLTLNETDYEMAISVLKNLEAEQNTPHIIAGIAFAKEAVEKQIQKKPIDIKSEYDGVYGKCPCCDSPVMDFDDYIRCKYCGQALKWKDEDNDKL